MSSSNRDTSVSAALYWGYLIKPDKTPTPILEQLLLGIANYINRHIAPWDIHCLTPTKLATFYRLVGGDYDPLFLDTSRASLSFIYQSLGCLHTLQPEKNPYSPPTVPALTPQGFVRWQTVQLLLEPDEHVPFLQEAVKRFELTNPADGEPFPSVLPREALPIKPDLQMTEWHDTVSEKLMLEAQASQMRHMPPRPQMALSDADPTDISRPSSGDSTVETSSMIGGAAGYFTQPHAYRNSRPHLPPTSTPFSQTRKTARGIAYPQQEQRQQQQQQKRQPPVYDAPWSPLRRRSSLPSDSRPPSYHHHHSSDWPRSPPTSPRRHQQQQNQPSRFAPSSQIEGDRQTRAKRHIRTPSTLSESSITSDDSSSSGGSSSSAASLSAGLQSQSQSSQNIYTSTTAAGAAGKGTDIRRSHSVGFFFPPSSSSSSSAAAAAAAGNRPGHHHHQQYYHHHHHHHHHHVNPNSNPNLNLPTQPNQSPLDHHNQRQSSTSTVNLPTTNMNTNTTTNGDYNPTLTASPPPPQPSNAPPPKPKEKGLNVR